MPFPDRCTKTRNQFWRTHSALKLWRSHHPNDPKLVQYNLRNWNHIVKYMVTLMLSIQIRLRPSHQMSHLSILENLWCDRMNVPFWRNNPYHIYTLMFVRTANTRKLVFNQHVPLHHNCILQTTLINVEKYQLLTVDVWKLTWNKRQQACNCINTYFTWPFFQKLRT